MNLRCFVVGVGHSGTSITCAILDSHPSLSAIPGETNILFRDTLSIKKTLRMWDSTYGDWVEKTPEHCCLVRKLFMVAPEAKVIWVMRHPLDVVGSRILRWMTERGLSREESLSLNTELYASRARNMLRHSDDKRIHRMRYEDLVADPQACARKVCDHLGVEYEPAMLDVGRVRRNWYAKTIKSAHNTRRDAQVSQAIFDGRGSGAANLTPAEREVVWEDLRSIAHPMGYETISIKG